MAQTGTGLSRRKGECAGKSCGINWIRHELVFRGADHKCSHNPNEISAFGPELVFREPPGQLVQRRGQPQWFWRGWCLRRASVNPPGDGIARVPAAPTGLGLLPARHLAFRLPTGMLAASYSRVRPEPPAADRTWSLPGLWHGDASWSPRGGTDRSRLRSGCLGHFWKAGLGKFSRAPKFMDLARAPGNGR
jgi:hypothetical protein